MMYRTGLVVGKFSPLHDGHLYLIRTAASQCERVIVLSYSVPEFPHCEAAEREFWFKNADLPRNVEYLILPPSPVTPANDAEEYAHRYFCADLLLDRFETTVDAVFSSEEYGAGFASFLTVNYMWRFGGIAHQVANVVVDLNRTHLPISGTDCRTNEAQRLAYTSGYVQSSFVPRIALLGGESTGKSTLAEALCDELETRCVDEYGRTLCEQIGGVDKLRYEDMYRIGEEQIRQERHQTMLAFPYTIRRPLICDTTALTTMFYSEQLFKRVDPRLAKLAKRRYDHIFLCAPDFPFVQDGTRANETFRKTGNDWYVDRLKGISHTVLTGPTKKRVKAVKAKLKELENGTN